MISLNVLARTVLQENVDYTSIAKPYFSQFAKTFSVKSEFKYLGLKNKEFIFSSDLTDLGFLQLIITDAKVIARITESYAYFGVIYTLNGLEQFDATICKMTKNKDEIVVKLFDDSDSDFSDKNTVFVNLFKSMVK